MKKAIIGILCFLIVVSLCFGYEKFFDYSYDGQTYGVDFSTPTKKNAEKFQDSFDYIYNISNTVVEFTRKSFSTIIQGFTGEISLEDCEYDEEFHTFIKTKIQEAEEYIQTLNWWNRTFVAPGRLDGARALVREGTYNLGYAGSAYNYNTDIETFKKYLGWSDDDILRIHNWCVLYERTHTYQGVLYDYRK